MFKTSVKHLAIDTQNVTSAANYHAWTLLRLCQSAGRLSLEDVAYHAASLIEEAQMLIRLADSMMELVDEEYDQQNRVTSYPRSEDAFADARDVFISEDEDQDDDE
ncbi:hypothetical protein HC928_12660 [bacterium]|nr:hypothetical protein [bacterium]